MVAEIKLNGDLPADLETIVDKCPAQGPPAGVVRGHHPGDELAYEQRRCH